MSKTLLSLGLATAIAASPAVAQAGIVGDFKAELAKKLGTKTGNAAAKAAAKTIAKYVIAKPKGDPKKIKNFTKIADKSLKKLLVDLKHFSTYNKFWSKFVMLNYFKKGKVAYDPNDNKFKGALKIMLKFIPVRFRDDDALVQAGFNQLKKNNNNKLGGTEAQLGELQQIVADITGVEPES